MSGRLVLLHCLAMALTDAFMRGNNIHADAEASGLRFLMKQQQQLHKG